MPERPTAGEGGALRRLALVVGLVLAALIVALIVWTLVRAPVGTQDHSATDAPEASAPAGGPPAGADEPPAADTADPGAPDEPPSSAGAEAGVSPQAAKAAVGELLEAVHDGDVTAAQALVSEQFTDMVGGAEWFAAGPDGLKSWEVVSVTSDGEVVWVLTTEKWDYGVQKSVYLVVGVDGRAVIDTIE